ncbi:glycosyl hydrolase family 95 catalytic domain-containing protein [Streptomyces sp. NBC_00887]|uniref:glycosyl hydrolase family 95 catalytic domain-containing protein n=1 Tax=Streptomyces sp. NBC_00887 TaxID=2975859 RepID=UPI003865B470|nr:glycoside hydrolase N-terminal domain-containing protein [Streptomyces sp. NBC_00887]WSY36328.1 glycoside hydrolase N-terminal domain-containing protein [Streptomyces sp. NBC_00887]
MAAPETGAIAAAADPFTLWYANPAADWHKEALPIGNGAMGATVYGGVGIEKLQFNEKTLWTGGPGAAGYNSGNWTSPRPAALQEVVDTINRDGQAGPPWVAGKLGQAKTGFGDYQTFGDLNLSMSGGEPSYTNYRRSLDIRNAVAGVRYDAGGAIFEREYFASHPDKVIAGRLGANQAGKVSFTLGYSSPRSDFTATANGGRLTIRGKLADNGLVFESQIQVKTQGGAVTDSGGQVTVTGADSATFVMSAGTNYAQKYPSYRGADPHESVSRAVDAASAKSYDSLKSAHTADQQGLFDRVRLDIGQSMPGQPTDQLRASYSGGASAQDRALEALFYQYGRYLLIASSRPGSLPANLQGVWNNSTSPPWSADYHTNINLQMNYWPAAQTNLAETAEPFTAFVEDLKNAGTRSATDMFGSPGWVVHNETNPYGFTGVHNYATSFWFPEANGWLASQVYDQYLFSKDTAFLRDRAYPLLKGASQFWLQNLRTDPRDGKLVVTPSLSPEHGDFTAGASMAQQIVWGLLTDTLAAAKELNVSSSFQGDLQAALGKLDPGLRVGNWGQLQEWKADRDRSDNTHRHVSHLYALHPGHQISPDTTPRFADAAEVSLDARGDGGTGFDSPGWSRAWKTNFWARLLDGDRAHKLLAEQLKSNTYPNLFDLHPLGNDSTFQIDGNFGATSGMTEMLLQSQSGDIRPLPALPGTWKNGSFTGLKARGNVTVGASWKEHGAAEFTLAPAKNGPVAVRSSMFLGAFSVVDTTTGRAITPTRDGQRISFDGEAGHVYKTTGALSTAIVGVASSKCVDVPAANSQDGNDLQLYTCNGTAAQKWTFSAPSGEIRALGKCMDVEAARTDDGTPVQLYTCNGTAAQKWMYDQQNQELEAFGKCLDANAAGTADGTKLILYACHGKTNQKWRLAG